MKSSFFNLYLISCLFLLSFSPLQALCRKYLLRLLPLSSPPSMHSVLRCHRSEVFFSYRELPALFLFLRRELLPLPHHRRFFLLPELLRRYLLQQVLLVMEQLVVDLNIYIQYQ